MCSVWNTVCDKSKNINLSPRNQPHLTPNDNDISEFVFQVNEASDIKNTDIAKELSLPPVKLHCSSKYYLRVADFGVMDVLALGVIL